MQVKPNIFKAYDIRGIYPDEVNEEMAYLMGRAFAVWSKAKGVVVGRDMRVSSTSVAEALIKGITETGVDVLDVGLASTPMFYFAVRHLKATAGIQVSASHNPKEYNGFKVVRRDEKGIIKVGIESGLGEIRDIIIKNEELRIKKGHKGTVDKVEGIQDAEIEAALKLVPLPKDLPPLTIVSDSANAMGGPMLEALFARAPSVNLVRMNFELDGTFPAHQPDPSQFETLRDLQERVLKEGADMGIAPDGDADRIFFIDERGKVIPASLITAFIAREILAPPPQSSPTGGGRKVGGGTILYDIRYTLNAKNAIEKFGGVPMVSKVGHAFISQKMREEEAIFAGESSGHYFFRDTGYAEGTPLTILYVLRALAREKKSLSKVLAPLSVAHESGELNFKLDSREKVHEVVSHLEERYVDGEISKLDGIAVEYSQWRFSVRASNTEPLLRLNVEGKTREVVEAKKQELMALCQ